MSSKGVQTLRTIGNMATEAAVAGRIAQAGLWGTRRPLFVSWALTHRCNGRCLYCDSRSAAGNELAVGEALDLVDQIASGETYWLHLTGGEPLLCEHVGRIIQRAKNKGLRVTLGSNGTLVPERLDDLRSLDTLSLSLDGREEVHDALRGKGAYQATIRAAESARNAGISLKFSTVLSAGNLDEVEEVLHLAGQFSATASFQPATEQTLWSHKENSEMPPVEGYREAIRKLIELKRGGAPVANSQPALEHLSKWPAPTKATCVGGMLFCRIMPDGEVLPCLRTHESTQQKNNALELGFERAFRRVDTVWCYNCWAANLVELSMLLQLKPEVWLGRATTTFSESLAGWLQMGKR